MAKVKEILKVVIDYSQFADGALGLEGYRRSDGGTNQHGFLSYTQAAGVPADALRVHGDVTFDHFPIERRSGTETVNILQVDVPEAFWMEKRDAAGLHDMDRWMQSQGLRRVRVEHVIAVFKQHYNKHLRAHMAALLERPWKGNAMLGGMYPHKTEALFSLAICCFRTQPDLNLFWETNIYEPLFDLLALPAN